MTATRAGLWWRWSVRDLRRRWLLVTTIALVIGLGTGTYAALLSTSAWRRASNDASFALLHTHDLRVRLTAGGTVAEGTLERLVRDVDHAASIDAVAERLVLPVQVAVAAGGRDVLATGELVGTARGSGREVDGVSRAAGRALTAADDAGTGTGTGAVVLDAAFTTANDLPAEGTVTLSGGATARYVGTGQSPEYFLLSGGQGGLPFLSQRSFAVVLAGLPTAQRLAALPGRVNDVVLTVGDPAALPAVRADVERALAALRPAVAADVDERADLDSYRVLYEDVEGDERLWRIVALLILTGAAFAALNLTSRVVEAQRREIGIGMALGVPRPLLAMRPLLFGAEVALIGVGLGLLVGWAVGIPLRGVFTGMLPLPVWITDLQPDVFAQAAALGFALPLAAVLGPVVRAVRAEPVDAIRVGHLAASGHGGRGPWRVRRTHHRHRAAVHHHRAARSGRRGWWRIPTRNLLRTPRRTALTAFGIAAAITTMTTTTGFLDSFDATLDASAREVLHTSPGRVAVSLRRLEPVDGPTVRRVRSLAAVGSLTPGTLLPITARNGSREVDLVAEVLGTGAPWSPRLVSGRSGDGLVLARKAAADLDLAVGDVVTVRHSKVTQNGVITTTSRLPVAGIHPDPARVMAYLEAGSAPVFGVAGLTNLLTVVPAPGHDATAVRRALLDVPGVGAVQPARAGIDAMRTGMEEFLGILRVAAAVTLLLALLIAVNTAGIGMDERRREHATMLAFGLPVRTVLLMTVLETALLGVLGALAGLAGGYAVLAWMAATTVPAVLPEIAVSAVLAPATVTTVLTLGVATVAAAPLLTLRRLARTDIPSTLRVVE